MDQSPDTTSSRITVVFVGLLAIMALAGTFALLWVGKDGGTVAIFTGLGGAAVGGMVNMATTRGTKVPTPSGPTTEAAPDPSAITVTHTDVTGFEKA